MTPFCSLQKRKHGVQTYLIASHLLGDIVQGLNDPQSQFLALLILCNSDVLNVSDQAQIVDEFAFDKQRAGSDDLLGRVEDAEEEVFVVAMRYPLVALVPLLPQPG
jgi:hypothetical protein